MQSVHTHLHHYSQHHRSGSLTKDLAKKYTKDQDMTNIQPISVTYSDKKLRILVEEYVIQQRTEFTLKGVFSYIIYRAMEEDRTRGNGLYESDQLSPVDCERGSRILEKIVAEHRIATNVTGFVKVME